MSDLHYFDRGWVGSTDEALAVDVCIYGGNACGVTAARKLAELGRTVAVLQPGKHLGGMTTGGLGWTDFGRKHVIGGMARQFYRDVGKLYGKDEEWQFEPSKAQQVMNALAEHDAVDVRFCQYLDRVEMEGQRITAIACLGGLTVKAKLFVDASYEGDLMARAGASYTVGREANGVYGEQLNGIQVHHFHQFSHPVSPYVVEGDAASGLLPHIEPGDLATQQGQGDRRVQAYNFRVCMTDDPALKIDWARPARFDERQYVLATRWFNSDKDRYNEQLRDWSDNPSDVPLKFDRLPNTTPGGYHKTDTNNHGAVSSDFIGANYAWPEGDYATRERIFQQHVAYQQGFYWHMANCPDVPQPYRDAYARWGLPSDEFVTTDHWPHQLYVREARRLVGDYVITEHDCTGDSVADDPIGMGSYTMDSHNCARFVGQIDGVESVRNEGDVQVPPTDPYPISYRAVVPKRGECANLFVPVCFSASHIAYGSARMEPVFMVMGESVACAAHLAIDSNAAVYDVKYDELRPMLEAAGQVLDQMRD